MRIGIDATFFGTNQPTGLGVYTLNIIKNLLRLNIEAEIWASREYDFKISKENLHLVLQQFSFLGSKTYLLRPTWMEFIFPKLLRNSQVNLLYSPVPGGMKSCPVPHVVTVHDLTPLTIPEDSPWPVRWNFRHRLPNILKKSAAIVAVSHHTKNDICSSYDIHPEKVHVIHAAYDHENFFLESKLDMLEKFGLINQPYILTVGSSNLRKNLLRLLEAFASLKKNIPHHLVIAGPTPKAEREKIQNYAASLDIEERSLILPYLTQKELRAFYNGADLFAYPSLYEGFGIPILEAMACGTPVLAANTTSIPEVAGNAAILVNPYSINAIAKGIMQITVDENIREQCISRGFIQTQKFSWENSAKQLMTLFNNVK